MSSELWVDEALKRSRWMRALALALVRDPVEADDLVQEAWARALASPPRESGSLRVWLERVMRNLVLQKARAGARHSALDRLAPPADSAAAPEETAQKFETQRALTEVMLGLPEPYRTTLRLHYFDEWSLRQIAQREGTSERAIETRLRRARDMVRKELLKRGPADRWVNGLFLLAWPRVGPGAGAAAAAGWAALAAVALFVAAWLWTRDSADPAPLLAGTSHALELPSPAGPAGGEADPPAAPEIQRAVAQGASILSVQARDARTLEPLAGVALRMEFYDEAKELLLREEWVSQPDGPHQVELPPATVRARAFGGSTRTHGPPDATRILRLRSAHASVDWNLELGPRAGNLRGSLRQADGRAVAFGVVGVWAKAEFEALTPPLWTETTDADGNFFVQRAKAAGQELLLGPWADGVAALQAYALDEELAEAETVDGILLVQGRLRSLRLRVLNEEGLPVVGARVEATPYSSEALEHAAARGQAIPSPQPARSSDAQGACLFELPHDETWIFHVWHESAVSQSVESPAGATEAIVLLTPARRLRGVVRDAAGRPVGGAEIRLDLAGLKKSTRSGPDGRYELMAPLAVGAEFRLVAAAPGTLAPQVIGPRVLGAADEALDFELTNGLPIEARLLTSAGEPWPPDAVVDADWSGGPLLPAPGAGGALETASIWLAQRRPQSVRRLAVDGSFRVDGMPAGSYRVFFENSEGLLAEVAVEAGDPPAAVRAGTYLSPRGSLRLEVSGAQDAEGSARQRKLVLRPLDPAQGGGHERTLHAGKAPLLIRGLSAGSWEVRVAGTLDEAVAVERILVAPASPTDLHLVMQPGRSGALFVHTADGSAVSDVSVTVLDAAGLPLPLAHGEAARTDATGRAWLGGLPLVEGLRLEMSWRSGRVERVPLGPFELATRTWRVFLPD